MPKTAVVALRAHSTRVAPPVRLRATPLYETTLDRFSDGSQTRLNRKFFLQSLICFLSPPQTKTRTAASDTPQLHASLQIVSKPFLSAAFD